MERFVKGEVVVLEFPYSDLSKTKKRPSLVVANLKGDNIILCQITGQPRPDLDIIKASLEIRDFPVAVTCPYFFLGLYLGSGDIICWLVKWSNEASFFRSEEGFTLKREDFQNGGLQRNSFIMPSFVFTIHKSKVNYSAGKIKQEKIKEVEKKLCEIFTR